MREIIFIDQEHEEFFYELIVRFKARNGGKFPDVYQQALAYTLSVNDETRRYLMGFLTWMHSKLDRLVCSMVGRQAEV
jgi:hypothetical protein